MENVLNLNIMKPFFGGQNVAVNDHKDEVKRIAWYSNQ